MAKRCTSCLGPGPFHKHKTSADGLAWQCASCIAVNGKKWYEANKERAKAQSWNAHLLRSYGISADDYETKLKAQHGVCAGCGHICPTGKRLAVDHDHATGAVRDLLCTNCNKALGHAHDDPALLRSLADYLETHAPVNG